MRERQSIRANLDIHTQWLQILELLTTEYKMAVYEMLKEVKALYKNEHAMRELPELVRKTLKNQIKLGRIKNRKLFI